MPCLGGTLGDCGDWDSTATAGFNLSGCCKKIAFSCGKTSDFYMKTTLFLRRVKRSFRRQESPKVATGQSNGAAPVQTKKARQRDALPGLRVPGCHRRLRRAGL